MTWVQIVGAIVQLVYLILKNKFEKDAEKKAKTETTLKELDNAIQSRDPSLVNLAFNKLRQL